MTFYDVCRAEYERVDQKCSLASSVFLSQIPFRVFTSHSHAKRTGVLVVEIIKHHNIHCSFYIKSYFFEERERERDGSKMCCSKNRKFI